MKQLLRLFIFLCPITATVAQVKTSEVEIESRDDTEITGNLNLIQGQVKMEHANPKINFQETDVSDRNIWMALNSGKLNFFEVDDENNPMVRFTINTNNDRVGINQFDPQYTLDVGGSMASRNLSLNFTNPHINFFESDTENQNWLIQANNGNLGFWTKYDDNSNPQQRVTFTDNGRIGINKTNPATTLHINGALKIDHHNTHLRFTETDRTSDGEWIITSNGGILRFIAASSDLSSLPSVLTIKHSSKFVGIGTISPTAKLHVNGTIKAPATDWSDFVFDEGYDLPSLEEVESHIAEHGHLKDIPSEEEVMRDDVDLTSMDAKLLQKIEELTLYLIEQNKRIDELEHQLSNKDN